MTIVDEYLSQPILKLVELIRQALPIPKILSPTSRTNYKAYFPVESSLISRMFWALNELLKSTLSL